MNAYCHDVGSDTHVRQKCPDSRCAICVGRHAHDRVSSSLQLTFYCHRTEEICDRATPTGKVMLLGEVFIVFVQNLSPCSFSRVVARGQAVMKLRIHIRIRVLAKRLRKPDARQRRHSETRHQMRPRASALRVRGGGCGGSKPSGSDESNAGVPPQIFIQDLDSHGDAPPPSPEQRRQHLFVALLEALFHGGAGSSRPVVKLPVLAHDRRLSSGARGLSLDALRAVRTFFEAHGALGKTMADVCKEEGFGASVCALTASTGLSLAESVVRIATAAGGHAAEGVSALVGDATTFFSYSWTGTTLGDMLAAIERTLAPLEAADGRTRYVWVDMFAASQNLLAGRYLPATQRERAELKRRDPAAYRARKEDTDTIFEHAIEAVGGGGGGSSAGEVVLYLSPLTGEWRAPEQPFLLPDRGSPPVGWMRKGPGAITRAWCCFELVKTLAKGCTLHVALSPADVDGFEALLTERFDEIAGIVAAIDVCDAQISKEEDREYILGEVGKLEGGLGSVTASVCESLREWLAAEGKAALGRMGAEERGTSVLLSIGRVALASAGQAGGGGASVPGGARGEACDAGRPPP